MSSTFLEEEKKHVFLHTVLGKLLNKSKDKNILQ